MSQLPSLIDIFVGVADPRHPHNVLVGVILGQQATATKSNERTAIRDRQADYVFRQTQSAPPV